MRCYYVFAVLVLLCLATSLVVCIFALLGDRWWVGHFEAEVPLSNKTDKYYLHIDFTVEYALSEVCWRVDVGDAQKFELNAHHRVCEHEDYGDAEKNMEPFLYVFICLIISVTFNACAIVFAFFKMPCLWWTKKHALRIPTVIATCLTALVNMVALILSNENFYYKASFMKHWALNPPLLGALRANSLKKEFTNVLGYVLDSVRATDMSDNFDKGLSFDLVCAAEFLLVCALLFIMLEMIFARRYKNKRNSHLLSPTYPTNTL